MNVVAIVGPTAAGKSAIAEQLAARHDAVIVSVDSMQVYRGMNIGTAKPTLTVRNRIPHRMIDIADASQDLTAGEFQRIGRAALHNTLESGVRVVIAGGSGLHFRALVDPLTFAPSDPEIRARLDAEASADLVRELLRIDPNAGEYVDIKNPRRVVRAIEIHMITTETPTDRATSAEAHAVANYVPLTPFKGFGMDCGDRSAQRVSDRFDAMIDLGLIDEVTRLAPELGRNARQAVGYKELLPVVSGATDIGQGRDEAVRATNALVKRQRTFFGRDPRITWLPWQDDENRRIADAVSAIGKAAQWTS